MLWGFWDWTGQVWMMSTYNSVSVKFILRHFTVTLRGNRLTPSIFLNFSAMFNLKCFHSFAYTQDRNQRYLKFLYRQTPVHSQSQSRFNLN
jgi:hypothetical protein